MIPNEQKPEPRDRGDGSVLDVHSIFETIQGEGPFSGMRATFIRLAGCNLQCPLCDTEYTKGRKEMTIHEILDELPQDGAPDLVVITGGEPFRQNIAQLCEALTERDVKVQVETNGTLMPMGFDKLKHMVFHGMLTIVCSPKTHHVDDYIHSLTHDYKYVLQGGEVDETDGLPLRALEHKVNVRVARPDYLMRRYRPDCPVTVWISPADEYDTLKNGFNLKAVEQSCLEFGHRISLQIHKTLGVA